MFFVAAIRAFTLLHAMHTGLAAHQALLVYSDFYVFHCYNVTHKRRFVKRFFQKVIHKVSWRPACCRAAHNLLAKLTHRLLTNIKVAHLYIRARQKKNPARAGRVVGCRAYSVTTTTSDFAGVQSFSRRLGLRAAMSKRFSTLLVTRLAYSKRSSATSCVRCCVTALLRL